MPKHFFNKARMYCLESSLLYLNRLAKSKRQLRCIWGNTKCIWVYFIHLFRILSIAVMFSLMCILSPQSTVASLHIPSAPPCALSWQDLDVVFMRQVWPVSSSRHVASRGKPPEVDRWLHTRPAASFCALNATQQQCGGHITTHYPQILWAVELFFKRGGRCAHHSRHQLYNTAPHCAPASKSLETRRRRLINFLSVSL